MVTKNLWVVGALAATIAGSTGIARADDSTPPTVPVSAYVLLTNQVFNGVDLNQAKAEGFSDGEIATMVKIANKSGQSFTDIKDRVISGASFGLLADEYNLRQRDIWDNKDYRDKIELYKLAWNSTGKEALKQKVMASQETYIAPMPSPMMTPPVVAPSNVAPTPAPMTTPATPTPDNTMTAPAPTTTPDTTVTPAPATPDTTTPAAPAPATPDTNTAPAPAPAP